MAVRRERVILELQDDFTGPLFRAAAAANVAAKDLDSLSGSAVRSSKATRDLDRDTDSLGRTTRTAEKDIDKYSGRLALLGQVLAVIGPSAVPISAVAIPAISGLTSALGFATVGLGASALAFRGLGDAIKAMEKARLEPTVENLQAAQDVLSRLSPEARAFAHEVESLVPALDQLSAASAAGLFPGVTRGLEDAKKALPLVQNVVSTISTAVGKAAEDAGASLASGDWDNFLTFLGTKGPEAIGKLSSATGNLTHGLAGLWMSTQPLNNDFLDWLDSATAKFDKWSNDLGSTQGFHDFMDYIHEVGPQVGETLGAVGNALVQVTQAVAPLGGASLHIIQAFADAISAIADSPLGTPILGLISTMSALNLATRGYQKVQAATFGGPAITGIRNSARAITQVTTAQERATLSSRKLAAVERERALSVDAGRKATIRNGLALAGFGLVASGATDKLNLTNTTTLAMAGALAGPWGIAIGGAIGGLMDLSSALTGANDDTAKFQDQVDKVVASAGPDKVAQLNALSKAIKDIKPPDSSWSLSNIGPNLLDNLNPFDDDRSSSEKQKAALEDRRKAVKKAIEDEARANDFAASAAGRLAARNERLAAALRAIPGEANKIADSFRNYSGELFAQGTSLDQFISRMRNEAKALANLGQNIGKAVGQGLRPGLVKYLADQGPAGALKLQQLIAGTPAQRTAANRAYAATLTATKKVTDALGDATKVKMGLATPFQIKVKYSQLDGAIGKARTLLSLLGKIGGYGDVNPGIGPAGPAGPPAPRKHKADGGLITGPGGPRDDLIPTMLSNTEYVMPADAVAHYGVGVMDAMRAKRLAGGGFAGDGKNIPWLSPQMANWALSGGSAQSPKSGGLPGYITRDLDLKFPKTLKQWQHALEVSQKAIEKETQQRDDLVSKRADLASTVSGAFQSDIFGGDKPSNWAYMSQAQRNQFLTQNPVNALNADTKNATQFENLLKVLTGKGLNGDAFAALAQTGDVARAQAFAAETPAQIAAFEKAFNNRARADASVGKYAGDFRYSKQIAESNVHLAAIRHEGAVLTKVVEKLEKSAKKAASDHAKAVAKARKAHQADLIQQLANG